MSENIAAGAELDECAREPIHIPGSIQPHGFLFALSKAGLTVLAASRNAAEALGAQPGELIGRPIAELLISAMAENLEATFASQQSGALFRIQFRDAPHLGDWDYMIHASEGSVILELIPHVGSGRLEALIGDVRYAVERIRRAAIPEDACDMLAKEIRALIGFDRVMVYRFDSDWNGEVIAEDRAADADSYRGHSFPASDIPAQARALYLLNTVRLIPDATYVPSPIIPPVLPSTGQPIDLSWAVLRSVSPIHLEYLRNMGVAASMSVSIVIGGKLWGLVACHHRKPRLLSNPILQSCELLAQAAAWYIDTHERTAVAERVEMARRIERELAAGANAQQDYRVKLASVAPALLDLTESQGLALFDRQSLWTAGQTPKKEQILALAEWLTESGEDEITTRSLPDRFPPAEKYLAAASGLAARVLPTGGWLMWFRAEWPHTLTWAGDPGKALNAKPGLGRINPRKSFASWRVSVGGQSRPWSVSALRALDEIQLLVLRSIMADQMRRLTESAFALTTYHDRMSAELESARVMQSSLLPSAQIQSEIGTKCGLEIASRAVNCTELGGDIWGIADLGDKRAGVYIVDFAGHGTTAALNSFRLHVLIQEFGHLQSDPAALLKALNLRLIQLLRPGTFATMFYGVIDTNLDRLTFAAAGSPPPIIRCGRDLPLKALDSSGMPLGISADADYSSSTVAFEAGAMIFLYSDIFIDDGEHRGGDGSALELARNCAAASSAEAFVARICAPFLDHPKVPLSDDLTAVCIARPT